MEVISFLLIPFILIFGGFYYLRGRSLFGDLSDRADERSWLIGLIMAGGVIACGIWAIATGTYTIYGRDGSFEVEGATAVSFAIATIAFGMVLHFHGLWSMTKRLWRFSEPGKLISLIVMVIFLLRGFYLFLMEF